jgi:hypothetical protein
MKQYRCESQRWTWGRVASGRLAVVLATIGVVLVCVVAPMQADVLLDNYGPAGTLFDDMQGYNSVGKWQHEASGGVSFNPTGSDYRLNTISVLATYFSGVSTGFELSIWDNNPNDTRSPIPGTRLASRSLTIDTGSTAYNEYVADFGSSIVLTKDSTYWAVVEATDPASDVYFGVLKGLVGDLLLPSARRAMYGNMLRRLNTDGTINTTVKDPYWMHMYNDSIKVTGTPVVPEPSGMVALCSGCAALLSFVRLRRRSQG